MDATGAFILAHTVPRELPLGLGLRIHGADALVPLWEATEAFLGGHQEPPYWAVPWAGGLALAWHLAREPGLLAGRRVVDFACGSGLVGLAARRLGAARVLLAEIDPLARAACRLNAALNGLDVEVAERDLLVGPDPEADLVLAGDVFYARAMSEAVLPWLRRQAARGAVVLVGDPGRKYLPTEGLTVLAEVEVPVSPDWESTRARRTRVLRLHG